MKLRKFLTYFFVVILIFGGYLFGYLVGHANLQFEKGFVPRVENLNLGQPKDIDFSQFWDVWQKLEKDYLKGVDKNKMFFGAIEGMVAGLGDPYTAFLDPAQSKAFLEEVKGEFEGVGLELGMKNNKLTVIAPIEDAPAQKAGIMAGDVIEKIDNQDASMMSLDQAVEAIRGKKGTEVSLTISRDGKSADYKIKRQLIKIKSVKWEMKDDIAYLRITQFSEDTSKLSYKAASDILAKKPKGVILDLRNNPGGYLDAAVDISSLFIKDGVIVYEQDKNGKKDEMKAQGNAKLGDLPLIVLVNRGSASASEITAGAIQDYKRGKIIGETTFGKGTVQSFEQLKDGSTLRITIAKWLTPLLREINDHGLSPDIEVKMTEDDIKAGKDPQLDKALEELNK